jgi:hypothetical protein
MRYWNCADCMRLITLTTILMNFLIAFSLLLAFLSRSQLSLLPSYRGSLLLSVHSQFVLGIAAKGQARSSRGRERLRYEVSSSAI